MEHLQVHSYSFYTQQVVVVELIGTSTCSHYNYHAVLLMLVVVLVVTSTACEAPVVLAACSTGC
eukprot:2252033-Lingulodinium_polyedra.AAC.1